jgi:hypothetical protein
MSDNRWQELKEEFRTVLAGRSKPLDAVLPPGIFILLNAIWTLQAAIIAALGVALVFSAVRLIRRQPFGYAIGGLGAVVIASLLAWFSGRAENYFLSTILSGFGLSLVALITILIKRPLASLSSALARGWPMAWYGLDQVRPAYTEVTWIWFAFFLLKPTLQLFLFNQGNADALGVVTLLTGWPATILVLAGSYLYGSRRLKRLKGPSVREYQEQSPPPWEGQLRGF